MKRSLLAKEGQPSFLLKGHRHPESSVSIVSLTPPYPSSSSLSRVSNPYDRSFSVTSLPPPSRSCQHTKSSRLRASSAPPRRPQSDYRHLARRRKESILFEKTITSTTLQVDGVPKGESFHSFLVGGRYNSTNHIDVQSLARLGVYVPRNPSARTFINPPGIIPPSPAVYGSHPIKRTASQVVDVSSQNLTDKGLLVVQQKLETRLNQDTVRPSENSQLCDKPGSRTLGDITPVSSGVNIPSERQLVEKYTPTDNVPDRSSENGDEESLSSASDLLSPEARLLTQEILLETDSLSKEDYSGKHQKLEPVPRGCTLSSSITPPALKAKSVTSLHQSTHQKTSPARPHSALQSSNKDPHTRSAIFIDLSKLCI